MYAQVSPTECNVRSAYLGQLINLAKNWHSQGHENSSNIQAPKFHIQDKSKSILKTGRGDPQHCEMSRIPNFLEDGLQTVVRLSGLHASCHLTPGILSSEPFVSYLQDCRVQEHNFNNPSYVSLTLNLDSNDSEHRFTAGILYKNIA
jgi:hypothetical protein